MKKNRKLLLVLTALAALFLSACGGGGGTDASSREEKLDLSGSSAAGEKTESEEKSGKQELTYVLSNLPDSIDPSYTNNSFAMYVIRNCFEGLVTYNQKGELEAGDAESWESNDDMTVYTFHLRKDLKWSDGTALTAKDYVYAARHVCTPETTAQYANLFTDYIVGAKEFYDQGDDSDFGVRAIDDQTLEYRLKGPCSFFLDLVSMWCYSPLKEETLTKNGDRWTQSAESYICNGPFRLSEVNNGESYVLVRNENYWDAEHTTLEKLTFRFVLDSSTALTAYENGEVDGIRSIPSGDIQRLKAENAGIIMEPSYGSVFYDINCQKEPYNNPLVRKAICLAVDREELISNVVQIDATPAYSMLPPGYSVDGKDITEGREDFSLKPKADPELAREALKEAGYEDPKSFPTLQLSYYSDDTAKKIAEAIAEMLKKNLGISVDVTSADWAVYYDGVRQGNYDVCAMGWSADYLNPMSFLPLVYTDDVSNNVRFSDPAYDKIVDEARVEPDQKKFAELVKEADKLQAAQYPVLPLYYKMNNFLMHDNVSGYYMIPDGSLFFRYTKLRK